MKKLISTVEAYIASTGSTWISEEELLKHSIDKKTIAEAVNEKNTLICVEIDQKKYLTTPDIAETENKVAYHAIRVLTDPCCKKVSEFFIRQQIKKAEMAFQLSFHEQQENAILCACKHNLSIITGGPGTGKTCVLNGIHYVLTQMGVKKIAYYAPTGKAASRITESTGHEAKTLHKGLRITAEQLVPTPFSAEVVIVDEISMLDIFTASALLQAVLSGTKLILVGDTDQLPSVGAGSVLRDFINSDVIPVVKLTKTFRQDNSSVLFQNITNIRLAYPYLLEGEDFHIYKKSKETVENMMVKEFIRLANKYGKENVICLMPYRKAGILCSNRMNVLLQNKLNPTAPFYKYQNTVYKLGDPVLQLVNREECANGDVGKIVKISEDGIVVKYGNTTVFYEENELEQITLAYAMSIHKSQGSEYKGVVTCLYNEHKTMLLRNLLYTAITRAKQECTVFCETTAIEKAIKTDGSDIRFTMLAEKLVHERNVFQKKYNL